MAGLVFRALGGGGAGGDSPSSGDSDGAGVLGFATLRGLVFVELSLTGFTGLGSAPAFRSLAIFDAIAGFSAPKCMVINLIFLPSSTICISSAVFSGVHKVAVPFVLGL